MRRPHAHTLISQPPSTEHAHVGQLGSLWPITASQRAATMHRGELTLEQCRSWAGWHPDQVPLVDGQLEFIALRTAEAHA